MDRRTARWGYVAIEVNLILWLVMAGLLAAGGASGEASALAWVGLGWSAIAQHWAYHRMLKSAPAVTTADAAG